MADLYLGIDPGVDLAHVLMNAGGAVLDYGVMKFPAALGAQRCPEVSLRAHLLILQSMTDRSEGGIIHVAVEIETTAAPYARVKTEREKKARMKALATHNRIVGAALAGASIERVSKVYESKANNVRKTHRALLARAGGFVPKGIAASRRHHVTDAWLIAEILRQELEGSRR